MGRAKGRILGDDVFAEQALMNTDEQFQQRHSLVQIVEAVCAVYQIQPSVLSEPGKHRDGSEARAVAAMFVLDSTNLKLADLAGILHRELSGLSQASSRLRKRLPEDGCLAERVEKVRIKLNEIPNCQA